LGCFIWRPDGEHQEGKQIEFSVFANFEATQIVNWCYSG